jgi:surface protein
MSNKLLFRLAVLVAAMMSALGAAAAEAYACYTSSNTTLTFYYDNYRSSRTGETYDLNVGSTRPDWYDDGTNFDVTKVVFNSTFAGARPTSTYSWFYMMENLQFITGLNYLNTSQVTNMAYMFSYCYELTNLDLYSFNTSRVTNMGSMFHGSYNLRTIYAGSGWSTAAVTYSANMFFNCPSLVGGQGTTYSESNPKDKTYARIDGGTSTPGYFTDPNAPIGYACYTPSNTTLTFYYDTQRSSRPGTTYDLNTGENYPGWYTDGTNADVTQVVFDPSFSDALPVSTHAWFRDMRILTSITNIENLNTSSVTNMGRMFMNCNYLTSIDVSHFDTNNVTNMQNMFFNCYRLTDIDLSKFNTSLVTNMFAMFQDCMSITSMDLSSFNTANVNDMRSMFSGCDGLTSLDLTSFNTANVTRTGSMFSYSNALTTIYVGSGWSSAAVTSSSDMFFNCTSLVGGQGTAYSSSNPTDKTYAHIDGGTSNPGYFTAGTEAYACYTPVNTTLTFYCDTQRSSRPGTTYDLNTDYNDTGWEADGTNELVTQVVFDSSFANARPTTTFSWFYGMTNLESITGMSYLNTSEVTNMGFMFTSCRVLTSLDLSSFNTSKVTYMRYMFAGSSNLRTIYVGSGWSTAAVTNSVNMFNNCTSLVGGQGTTYDANHIDKAYAHIDGGPSNPGYFTAKNAALRGDVNGDGSVNISDVTALIDYLLSGNASGISLSGADCNQDNSVNISDVTSLIDYLLSGTWN